FAGQLVAERGSDGTVRYYFGDHLGHTHLLVSATGTTCWDADYYPYGGPVVFTMAGCQPVYQFGGMEREVEYSPDLNEAAFRYHNSALARWMSADPVSGNVFNPQSWNRYAYGLNNPSNLVDPAGLFAGDCGDPFYYTTHAECPSGGGGGSETLCLADDPTCD